MQDRLKICIVGRHDIPPTIRLSAAMCPAMSSRSTLSGARPKRDRPDNGRHVTVVLGPTNTGKTHLALERMTGYASGMIGFPLRLLARENYDRLVARLGAPKVGLITGEERILPAGARYLCCTVESMPLGGAPVMDLSLIHI